MLDNASEVFVCIDGLGKHHRQRETQGDAFIPHKWQHSYPFAKQGCETECVLKRAKAAEIRKNTDEIAN